MTQMQITKEFENFTVKADAMEITMDKIVGRHLQIEKRYHNGKVGQYPMVMPQQLKAEIQDEFNMDVYTEDGVKHFDNWQILRDALMVAKDGKVITERDVVLLIAQMVSVGMEHIKAFRYEKGLSLSM